MVQGWFGGACGRPAACPACQCCDCFYAKARTICYLNLSAAHPVPKSSSSGGQDVCLRARNAVLNARQCSKPPCPCFCAGISDSVSAGSSFSRLLLVCVLFAPLLNSPRESSVASLRLRPVPCGRYKSRRASVLEHSAYRTRQAPSCSTPQHSYGLYCSKLLDVSAVPNYDIPLYTPHQTRRSSGLILKLNG